MPADAMNRIDVLRSARDAAGMLLVGLDFDGTLAPIVPVPDDAAMPHATLSVLERLGRRADTRIAIVSGRSLADLRTRVPLAAVHFAGNHGLEISGPGVERMHPDAAAARPRLQQIAHELRTALPQLAGVIVEDKGVTLSVHYRMVHDDADAERVRSAVHDVAAGDGVVLTEGKKVVEIRPDVDWHKGRAFAFLRETLEQEHGRAPAIFIGDDRTDEDAFRTLGDTDCSIVVGNPPPHPSIAQCCLHDTAAVAEFLHRLAE
jgi:trehalose 6-phosphate phosphatase